MNQSFKLQDRRSTLPPKWSAPAATAPLSDLWKGLADVKVSCASSACSHELHCFRLTKKLAASLTPGTCRECKQSLVLMRRVAERDLADVDYTFESLQREFIRHYFWHVPFGEKALNYAYRAGWEELEKRVPRQLRTRIGKANPAYDGRQTPLKLEKANAIDLGMHAVAACCRRCVEYWHGIERGRELTTNEVEYLTELVLKFLHARLPSLERSPVQSAAEENE